MRSAWQGICLWAVALLSFASVCHAQTASTPEDEYRKAIKVSEDIHPLGDNPFGEQISLYNGGLSFSQTDISLPGNGPTLQLSRSFQIEGKDEFFTTMLDQTFGDWEIDLPRIETVAAHGGSLTSWQTSGTAQPDAVRNQRCTYFAAPPPVTFVGDSLANDWTSYEWWNGYHLIVPGAGDQELLPRSPANTLSPTMPDKTFSIVTKQYWEVSCLGQTSSGEPGEAFFAVAPDGTKYWFDYLVYRGYSPVKKALGSGPGPDFAASMVGGPQPNAVETNILERRKAWMLVTRIEDRFGNALTYHYAAGRLSSIDATDGRRLTVEYDANSPRIHKLTLTTQAPESPPRTWIYYYGDGGASAARADLQSVTLPDGHAWTYNLSGLVNAKLDFSYGAAPGTCYVPSSPRNLGAIFSGTITQPSGLMGTFTVKSMAHGRSGVYRDCWGVRQAPNVDGYAITPSLWYAFSLVSMQVSGAGIPPAQVPTTYSYSPPNNSWSVDCPTTASCASTVTTDVVDPDGHATRYTFSNRYDYTESLLLSTDYHGTGITSAVLRTESNQYAPPTTGPWPSSIGGNLQNGKENDAQTTQLFPLNQRTISQDGDTYTWQAEAFDAYGNVTQTMRSNSVAGQSAIEESTTYRNDPALWVLGLPLQVTNNTKNEVESTNTYTTSNDTLLTRARFGQTLMSYTFNSAGQLASFTDGGSTSDGNHNTTTLGNYKRGIPQTIGYPDSTSETLAVDDFGQISAITDQAGHTTSYGYDGVGRITGITYPTGAEVAWLPKTFTYSFVTSTERGVPANHWRRTTTTGSAVGVTYFDAMLRPVLSDSVIGSAVQASTLSIYDAKGQKIFSAYPSDTALTFSLSPTVAGSTTTYDALGRVTQVAQASELGTLTSRMAYLSGARQQVTDPKGNVTTTSYQVFDAPSDDAPILVQAPAGITQTIARDLYGNPLSITQSGLYGTENSNVTKTLAYDPYHRLCRTTEPESGSTVMAYDSANNLAWSAAGLTITGGTPGTEANCGRTQMTAAAKTTRSYDPMNRVLTVNYPSGDDTSFTYDARGNLATSLSGLATWTYTRNARGLLTKEALGIEGYVWPLSYGYDSYGALATVTYPDGLAVAYAPDALGRPTQVGSYASGLSYLPDGAVAHFTYADGTQYLAEENTRQIVKNLSYAGTAAVDFSQDFVYDKNANLTTVTDLVNGQRDKSFSYDALNRLTQAQATSYLWGTESYSYDALNNLRSLTSDGLTRAYQYDTQNRLAAIKNGSTTLHSFVYDLRGNTTQKDTTNRLFDSANRLTQVVGVEGYAYDAAGRRVKQTPASGAPTYALYSQAGQLMAQFAPATGTMTDYVHLGPRLLAEVDTQSLGAPGSVSFDANPNNGSYTVSWGAVPGASSYLLQESANGGGWTTVYSGSAASTVLSGRAGGSYVYRMEGCVGTTCGAWTSSATLGVRPALSTVTVPSGTINGTYSVSWTAPASTTGYDVQESVNGGSWTTIASNTVATSVSRPGSSSGSYTYQVSAKNAYGSRGWVGTAAVNVDTTYGVLPAAPAALTVPASSNNGSATLSWSASALTTRYVVEQSSNGGVSWTGVYNSSGTTTALSGLADGSYGYHVQACNTYGCSAWMVGSATLVVTHPPSTAPTVSAPVSSPNGGYTVSWSGVAGQVSYTLQEQVNGGAWTTVQTNGLTGWSTSGRGNGTYGYRVQACNVGGCGPWSNTDTITVLLPPTPPASISVPATSSGSIAVNWAASTTATSYTLQQRLGAGTWASVYTGSAISSTRTVTTSGSYTYQVQACNASGCSVYRVSGAVAVTLPPASAPSLTVPATSSSGSYTVSWGAVTGATSYTLQEQVNGGSWTTIQASSATSKALIGKANGGYGYKVQACNAGGCGAWSAVQTVSVALVPAVPTGLGVTILQPPSLGRYIVHFTAVSGATRYELEETRDSTGAAATIYNMGTSTSQDFRQFDTTDTFHYRARACNGVGCSGWSAAVAVEVHS